MFSIDVENNDDEIDVSMDDIIMNLASFNKNELLDLKGELEYQLDNDVLFPALEGGDVNRERLTNKNQYTIYLDRANNTGRSFTRYEPSRNPDHLTKL